MRGRARAAAAKLERETQAIFEALGRGGDVALRVHEDGRVFGGTFALEVATREAVLPPTGGLTARGLGLVRLSGVSFRARGADPGEASLARRLDSDRRLQEALAKVDFQRIRVEPDGRPVIRHMGGSVVWMLFPPLVRAVPLTRGQASAIVAALDAFAAAGKTETE